MTEGLKDQEGHQTPIAVPKEVIETLNSIVASQAGEHELKRRELELRGAELEKQSDYANRALEVQATDRREHRELYLKVTRDRYWFIVGALVVVFIFVGWLVLNNQTDLAKDILKIGLGFASGGATGYFAGKTKKNEQNGS